MYMPPAARFGYLVVIINIGTRVFPFFFLFFALQAAPPRSSSNEKRRLGTERGGSLISQDEIGLFDEILLCCCCGLHYVVRFLGLRNKTTAMRCEKRSYIPILGGMHHVCTDMVPVHVCVCDVHSYTTTMLSIIRGPVVSMKCFIYSIAAPFPGRGVEDDMIRMVAVIIVLIKFRSTVMANAAPR